MVGEAVLALPISSVRHFSGDRNEFDLFLLPSFSSFILSSSSLSLSVSLLQSRASIALQSSRTSSPSGSWTTATVTWLASPNTCSVETLPSFTQKPRRSCPAWARQRPPVRRKTVRKTGASRQKSWNLACETHECDVNIQINRNKLGEKRSKLAFG